MQAQRATEAEQPEKDGREPLIQPVPSWLGSESPKSFSKNASDMLALPTVHHDQPAGFPAGDSKGFVGENPSVAGFDF